MTTPKRRKVLSGLLSALALAFASAPVRADSDAAVEFFRAAQLDSERTVRTLLAQGLDPNVHEPERGETGLIVAMRYDANRVFNVLLADPKIKLEEQAANGNTALMMAAFRHNKAAVLALLAKGACVNRPGWTALHYAAASGDVPIMQILLDHGARIDAGSPSSVTPLMLAAREGMEDAARLLLARGADVTLKDAGFGIDAAEFAVRADKPWIAQAIRAHLAGKKRR